MRIVHYVDKCDVVGDKLFVVSRAFTHFEDIKIIIDIKDVVISSGQHPIDYAEISGVLLHFNEKLTRREFKSLYSMAYWLRKEILEIERFPAGTNIRIKAFCYVDDRSEKVDTGFYQK